MGSSYSHEISDYPNPCDTIENKRIQLYQNSSTVGQIELLMNSMIFMPPPMNDLPKIPPEWMRFIEFENDNTTHKISYFVIDPSPDFIEKPKYILWSHGNSCILLTEYLRVQKLHSKLGGRVGFIVYDYEGYGYSSGKYTEKTVTTIYLVW